jgi:hypothetical protein
VACCRARSLAAADKVLVVPEKFNGAAEVIKLERRTLVRRSGGGVWSVGLFLSLHCTLTASHAGVRVA